MKQKILYLICPLVLTGCLGSIITGDTAYLCEDYPDIRSVPERAEATKTRAIHEKCEKAERAEEYQKLEQDRIEIQARDKALREGKS